MKRYLSVHVYRNDLMGKTYPQVTNMDNIALLVEIPDGHITEEDVKEYKQAVILEKKVIMGNHVFFRPTNIPAGYHSMFGGNFVWASDSRFRNLYPSPVPVHDRVEGAYFK